MKKTIRLTESELINLVQRIIKEQEGFDRLDDTPIEDEPLFDDKNNDIEDFGFDTEDNFEDDVDELYTVFENGKLITEWSFDEIRDRSNYEI